MPADAELEDLYGAHAQALYHFLLSLTRNEADTKDLLQEVFVKLARRPSLLRGVREPRAFLLTMAHHGALDWLRRREALERRDRAIERDVPLFADAADPDEATFRMALARAMASLPEKQRAVVHLKLWEDLTFDAIARILDLSPNTVGSRYRYGLDKLRQHLRPYYDGAQKSGNRPDAMDSATRPSL